ncbi:hypothetical protein F7725_023659 [Dissostichus mawsoni]|uniref:Integrase catalytic domain-containing protein n=1 Tax=Dissostichus mawsoni TaxID=36200 RepID=A0A7J5Y014_DISMA|nr:hypothetical protein F7725_023659 [Dissostichus mawsoni]
MDIGLRAIGDHLRSLADHLENGEPKDYVQFRVERCIEDLAQLDMDVDVNPAVFESFKRLPANLKSSRKQRRRPLGVHLSCCPQTLLKHIFVGGTPLGTSRRCSGVQDLLTLLDDNSLDETVTQILQHHPDSGYKMMVGHLNARGNRIQRQRVQESMRRVDPGGVLIRTLQLNPRMRRKYFVPAPNSLWHIDGNHKLIRYSIIINTLKHCSNIRRIRPFKCVNVCTYISGLTLMCAYTYPFRWRFVVHGGFDGFSRLVVYLSAATNNRAATVLRSFLEAANVYGVPSRVRSDKGGENVDVARYMVANRERTGIHTLLAGVSIIKGTLNFKIERLWRDVYVGVLDLFYTIEKAFSILTEVHVYALHWCFVPHIQKHLQFFQQGWNCHRLSTEGNRSPLQLWTRHEREAQQEPIQVDIEFGVDWTGPCAHRQPHVVVPEVQLQRSLTDQEVERLPDPDGPLSNVWNVYVQTVGLLTEMLQ